MPLQYVNKTTNSKRPRTDTGESISAESAEKRLHTDTGESISAELLQQLDSGMGPLFSNKRFIKTFQYLFGKNKSLEWCCQHILQTSQNGDYSYLPNIYSSVGACQLMDVPAIPDSVVRLFAKLLMTSVYQKLEEPSENNMVLCFFRDKLISVRITESKIEGGLHVFFSETFRIMLINDGKSLRYVAKLRPDLRLRNEKKSGKVYFVSSDDTSNPPVIMGGGSYGFAFKIMGVVDGKWYVVKVVDVKESAKHEWSALKLVKGQHISLQQGIQLHTDRVGDFKHVIVSEFQGDIALSMVRESNRRLNLQQLIWMFVRTLADGLKQMHTIDFLHCDIKPSNIILSQNKDDVDILVLIDFGIAEKKGKQPHDAQSYYTSWFRYPGLILYDFMKKFNIRSGSFIERPKMNPVMDWWAFFVTIPNTISDKSNDFLGFHSKTEAKIKTEMIETSPVAQLMRTLEPWLGKKNRDISFIREIYFSLLNETGDVSFLKILNRYGIPCKDSTLYDQYVSTFKELRSNHPMIEHVRNVFKHVKPEKPEIDISGPIGMLVDLFVEILRDGADLSLLDCLTMDHIQRWLDKLNETLLELCRLKTKIFFY